MAEEDKILLQAVARVVVNDADGPLAEQLERRAAADVAASGDQEGAPRLATAAAGPPSRTERPPGRTGASRFNGLGASRPTGVSTSSRRRATGARPRLGQRHREPWFGTVVSESGSAYTWCENANMYR